jgi:uncharacterized membrane protein
MKRATIVLGGAAGAGFMYFLDPDRGRRRRALARDKAIHATHRTSTFLSMLSRDVVNRVRGAVAGARSLVTGEEPSDDVIAERIRSRLGRLVSHPHAIRVRVQDGVATLYGPVLTSEVDRLLHAVRTVAGVTSVETQLEVHISPESVPGLQGPSRPRRETRSFQAEMWSPTERVIAGAAAVGLAWIGRRIGGPARLGAGAVGAALLARAVANQPLARIVGVGPGPLGFKIQKTIHIGTSPQRVYELLSDCESYSCFMTHVIDVRDLGDGRCRWKVRGPASVPIEYETQITRDVPGELIAWKTLPGSTVRHAGIARLEPSERGTRLDIHMSYRPPAGAIGHAIATLLGTDPKSALDDDLARLKSLIESGVTTAGHGKVRLDEVHTAPTSRKGEAA